METIFSNLAYDRRRSAQSLLSRFLGSVRPAELDAAELRLRCNHYRHHCEKYLLSASPARTVVRHEKFKTGRAKEFAKICAHFGQPLDESRMERAFATVSPAALVAKTGDTPEMGRHMLAEDYQASRLAFATQWGPFIEEQVITPELCPFFS